MSKIVKLYNFADAKLGNCTNYIVADVYKTAFNKIKLFYDNFFIKVSRKVLVIDAHRD
jgi:hypothetical protein